jgi:hypothetical protein
MASHGLRTLFTVATSQEEKLASVNELSRPQQRVGNTTFFKGMLGFIIMFRFRTSCSHAEHSLGSIERNNYRI